MDWMRKVSFTPHTGTAATPSALATAACPVLVLNTVANGTGRPLLWTATLLTTLDVTFA